MKNLFLICLLWSGLFISCQPDATDEPNPTPTGIDFIGNWNRDSVIVNDIPPSGIRSRIETEINYGVYSFNTDLKTGVLNLSGSDFAITWNYLQTANTINISEIDWANQTYSIESKSATKLVLTGLKDIGGGFKNERIIYLTKK